VDLASIPAVAERMREVESRMDGRGRLLVRYSGTEPLVRIMLEGESMAELESHATVLGDVIRKALG